MKKVLLISLALISIGAQGYSQTEYCDNFADTLTYPETYTGDDTLGHLYDLYPIENPTNSGWALNGTYPGWWGGSHVNFNFDGLDQNITIDAYGLKIDDYWKEHTSFSINFSDEIPLDTIFPLTVAGVSVDLDTNFTEPGGSIMKYYRLELSGSVENVIMTGAEFGVREICSNSIALGTPSNIPEYQPVKIFPNPATHLLNVSTSEPIKALYITNLQGQRVHNRIADGALFYSTDISNYIPGVYFVTIVLENEEVRTKKIIVKH